MKNNGGKGLYEIGEVTELLCGCVMIAEEIGYTHYVWPECKIDNKFHPDINGYAYKSWGAMPVEAKSKIRFERE
jgi:hypothetical protein